MQLFGGRTDFFDKGIFNRHVNIFVCLVEFEFAISNFTPDSFETAFYFRKLGFGNELALRQHLRMCYRAGDIVFVKPFVDTEGLNEIDHKSVRCARKSVFPVPRLCSGW